MAKWPNHFISGKQFQKRPNLADLAFFKAKWQPCLIKYLKVQEAKELKGASGPKSAARREEVQVRCAAQLPSLQLHSCISLHRFTLKRFDVDYVQNGLA
jgi:hypothetical protein